MTEFEQFDQVWNKHFLTTEKKNLIQFSGTYGSLGLTDRGRETKERYTNILFSIWKHHQDWSDDYGFQIKCRERVIYRVLDLAEKAGLLIKVGNYSVGRFTRQYRKNCALFDMIYRDQYNIYGAWLKNFDWQNIKTEFDIVHDDLIDNMNRTANANNPHFATNSVMARKGYKKLNYDLVKLHILSNAMLPYYFNHLETMNKNAEHPDLEFTTWLKYDTAHLPTGRPYSYFCSTLNRKKKHKINDTSLEFRDDFLKRIGLPDYYEVYDIKSEIPRVNYLFHTGEWKDDDYDFYEEIINDYQLRMPDEDRISRGKAGANNYNDSMKQLFMRIYFGKGSEKQSFMGYKDDYMKRNKESWENIQNAIKNKLWPAFEKDEFFPYTFDEWYELCASTEKICGKSIGNLVFWYSFMLETEVKIELLKRGKKVYNVYDGFYYNSDISEEIREILKEKSIYIYDNYMQCIKL
jgi:hypothetical protein